MPTRDFKLYLAPMEGVTDWIMRDTLSQLGGLDFCVTEFLRVTKVLHPNKVFVRHCPELLTNSMTRAGTMVYFQLLGGEPLPMAENARRAADLGAAGIDLNFGCPAKTVNRHDGGAVLLKSPHRLYDITKTVRQNVPSEIPVSAKMRLGFEDTALCIENAKALEEAGAQWLTVHCRTKAQGYRPPAHWAWIPQIQEHLKIPVIANGDISTVETFEACRRETRAQSYMIGRAALSNPFLFKKIKEAHGLALEDQREWPEIEALLVPFFEICSREVNDYFATSRTKQWLKHLALRYPEAKEMFNRIKVCMKPRDFILALQQSLLYSRFNDGATNNGSIRL